MDRKENDVRDVRLLTSSVIPIFLRIFHCLESIFSAGNTGGVPKSSVSLVSLFAAAEIGCPVQWNPKGKRTLNPCNLLKRAVKSTLVIV